MKNAFCLSCFLLLCITGKAQYIIPDANQQPAWVFPIWFENGDGQKDTLYIGYDFTASWLGYLPQDSIFGAHTIEIDTSIFNVSWRWAFGSGAMIADTALKVIVCSLNGSNIFPEPSIGQINFLHAIYPVKVSWDVSLLRSDSLPFITQSPAPRAQVEFYFEMGTFGGAYSNGILLCSTGNTLLVTDTTSNGFNYCYTTDSVRFQDIFGTAGATPGYLIFTVQTWMGEYLKVSDENEKEQPIIFPNPAHNYFNIQIHEKTICTNRIFQLFNSNGKLVFEKQIIDNKNNIIEFNENKSFTPGIYLIRINYCNELRNSFKMLIY